jgi:hypothetical protein
MLCHDVSKHSIILRFGIICLRCCKDEASTVQGFGVLLVMRTSLIKTTADSNACTYTIVCPNEASDRCKSNCDYLACKVPV